MTGELSPDQVDALLREQTTARLGCHADGQTYVVPVTYAYDGEALIGHTAEGRKVRMMRQNPEVCVEVDRVDGLSDWRSVIAWGRYEELAGAEAERALATLVARFADGEVSRTSLPAHAHERGAATHPAADPSAVVYRIPLTRRTGRFETP